MPDGKELLSQLRAGERLFFGFNDHLNADVAHRLLDRIEEASGERISRAVIIGGNVTGIMVWIEGLAPNPIDEAFMRNDCGQGR